MSRGSVMCVCESCGTQFFRDGDSSTQQSCDIKPFPRITHDKIADACRNGELASLRVASETDWIMAQNYLCAKCLDGLRGAKHRKSPGR